MAAKTDEAHWAQVAQQWIAWLAPRSMTLFGHIATH